MSFHLIDTSATFQLYSKNLDLVLELSAAVHCDPQTILLSVCSVPPYLRHGGSLIVPKSEVLLR